MLSSGSGSDGADVSVTTAVRQMVDDARAYADAELTLVKRRASVTAGAGGRAVALGLAGLVLVQAALIATLIGLIWILSERIGVGWSVVTVVGVTALIAIVLMMAGRKQIAVAKKGLKADV